MLEPSKPLDVDVAAPPAADAPQPPPAQRPERGRGHGRLQLFGLAAVVAAAGVVGVGVTRRSVAATEVKTWTEAQAIPTVALAAVKPATDAPLVLPGQVEAYNVAEVNARVTGYLEEWMADIGSRVKAGDTLAVLDAPELRQQLEQARADFGAAQANARLAASTNARWQQLLKNNTASKADAEEKAADLAAKTAQVAAAEANVRRLEETNAFTRILAPFDGVVTRRSAQLGQLVVAGAPTTPMFVVADDSKLRVYVRVPQPYVSRLHVGDAAQLTVPEHPGRTFQATLARTSEAIDRTSGALTAELEIDNADHLLKPGAYAQARFAIAPSEQTVSLPASALLFRDVGMMIGVVGQDGVVRLRQVEIARDLGTTVEIASGVAPTDRVVDNPPDTLVEGQTVRVAEPAPARS